MSTVDSNAGDDSWGNERPSTITIMQRPKASKVPVRDSWDDDDDEDESVTDSKLMWEQANARAPMPGVQLSTTTTVTGISLPPPAAFKEPLKILKRPGSETKSPSTSPSPLLSPQSTKTLQERESQYKAARERIFGDKETDKDRNTSSSTTHSHSVNEGQRSFIIRDPVGPPAGNQGSNNFQQRRKKQDSKDTLHPE